MDVGSRDPVSYEIGKISVQREKATPQDDRSEWEELHSEKRADIKFHSEPPMRGDDPVMRVNYGSQTGTIRCDGLENARGLFQTVYIEIAQLLGKDPEDLFEVAMEFGENKVTFRTSDPHRLVRTIRRLKEEEFLVPPD